MLRTVPRLEPSSIASTGIVRSTGTSPTVIWAALNVWPRGSGGPSRTWKKPSSSKTIVCPIRHFSSFERNCSSDTGITRVSCRLPDSTFSYYFSKFATNWGWATWRRAWQHYDVGVAAWPSVRNTTWLLDIVADRRVAASWAHMLDLAHSHALGTWDYQWLFACWQQQGWSIQPSVSMITNIGFGEDATHTTSSCHDPRADVKHAEMLFPLQHPAPLMQNRKADRVYLRQVVLPSVSDPSLGIWLQKKWWDFTNAHPSLKSWHTFWQRIVQKSLALFGQRKRRTFS